MVAAPRSALWLTRRDDTHSQLCEFERGQIRRMRPRGLIALGMRKALGGYISSTDVCGLLTDPLITRWTVTNAELRVRLCHLAASCHLHDMHVGST